jgi:hypothetical protein
MLFRRLGSGAEDSLNKTNFTTCAAAYISLGAGMSLRCAHERRRRLKRPSSRRAGWNWKEGGYGFDDWMTSTDDSSASRRKQRR